MSREARIAAIEAELALPLSASPPPPDTPRQVFYGVSLHPDEAHERVLASGHAAVGQSGLAAGVSD